MSRFYLPHDDGGIDIRWHGHGVRYCEMGCEGSRCEV